MEEINIPDDLSGLSGDELRALLNQVNEAGKTVAADARKAEGEDRDELLKTLEALKEQQERLETAITASEQAEADAQAAIDEAASAFEDESDDDSDEDEEDTEETEEVVEETTDEVEPVAASTKGAKFKIQRKSRELPEEQGKPGNRGASFRAGGQMIDSLEALMRLGQNADRMAPRAETGRVIMASFNRLPSGMDVVRGDRSAWDNTRIIRNSSVGANDVLTAAGGFCGPAEAVTDITECGRTDTPIGDLLAKFTARGKYRYIHQVGLDAVGAGITYWTEADDTATDPFVPKPCYHLECETEEEAKIIMIPACFQYGVGQAWSNPEQVAATLAKFDVALARHSEALVLQRIHEQSNQLTYAPPVGESLTNGLIRLVGELLAWASFNGRNSLDGYVLEIPETLLLMVLVDSKIKAWVGPTLTREQIIATIEDMGVRVVVSPDVRALAPVGPIDVLPAAPAPAGGPNAKPHTWQELLLFKPDDFKHGIADVDVAVQTDITTARNNDRSVFLETVNSIEKLGCSPSFSALYNCINPTGAQPDLVAADDDYNACPEPDAYVYPGAEI